MIRDPKNIQVIGHWNTCFFFSFFCNILGRHQFTSWEILRLWRGVWVFLSWLFQCGSFIASKLGIWFVPHSLLKTMKASWAYYWSLLSQDESFFIISTLPLAAEGLRNSISQIGPFTSHGPFFPIIFLLPSLFSFPKGVVSAFPGLVFWLPTLVVSNSRKGLGFPK